MNDRTSTAIRVAAAGAVLFVAAIAAVISYQHAYALVISHGESGLTAKALPLTVDGLIATCSLVLLDAARRRQRAPVLAWVLLGCGIAATLGANVAYGLSHGWVGAIIAGWPAVVAVGSFEMLARLVRSDPAPEVPEVHHVAEVFRTEHVIDEAPEPADVPALLPEEVRAAEVFGERVQAGDVPSIRAIKEALGVGQPKARRVRTHLLALAEG